jgi:PhnB protein
MAVNWLPEGFTTVTPYLVIDGAEKAIEFYSKTLGAELIDKSAGPDGKIMNAQIKIGNAMIMLNDEFPDYGAIGPKKIGGTAVTMHIYVPDANATWEKVKTSGAEITMPMSDQFWGDRYGCFTDPFGHKWSIAQRIENVSDEDMQKRMAEAGHA